MDAPDSTHHNRVRVVRATAPDLQLRQRCEAHERIGCYLHQLVEAECPTGGGVSRYLSRKLHQNAQLLELGEVGKQMWR